MLFIRSLNVSLMQATLAAEYAKSACIFSLIMFSICPMITRQQAIDLYGSAIGLASALGYKSRHVVYMWPKNGPIPREPYLTLRYELRPEAFDADGNYIGPQPAGEVADAA